MLSKSCFAIVEECPAANQLERSRPRAEAQRQPLPERKDGLRGAALFLIVDFLEISVNDLVVAVTTTGTTTGTAAGSAGARSGPTLRAVAARFGLRLVEGLAQLHRDLSQRFGLGLDLVGILAGQGALQGLHRILHRLAIAGRHLFAGLREAALGGVDQPVGMVARLDQLAPLLV